MSYFTFAGCPKNARCGRRGVSITVPIVTGEPVTTNPSLAPASPSGLFPYWPCRNCRRMFRRFSSAVATSRKGHRSPRSDQGSAQTRLRCLKQKRADRGRPARPDAHRLEQESGTTALRRRADDGRARPMRPVTATRLRCQTDCGKRQRSQVLFV